MLKNGIDVSYSQGQIDWGKVKANGIDFAIIRAGWAGYDGKIADNGGVDKRFEENCKQATLAGVDFGVYVFSYVKTAMAARAAALEVVRMVHQDYQLTYPIVFDMEDSNAVRYSSMSKAENTAIAKAFLEAVESQGYYAMLYATKSMVENHLNMSELAPYDFWLAHVADNDGNPRTSTNYTGPYGIWQYSWVGKVDGINGDVDLDYAYQDYPAIVKAAGLNGFTGDDREDILHDLEEQARECSCCNDKAPILDSIAAIKREIAKMESTLDKE